MGSHTNSAWTDDPASEHPADPYALQHGVGATTLVGETAFITSDTGASRRLQEANRLLEQLTAEEETNYSFTF